MMGVMLGFACVGVFLFGRDGAALSFVGMFVGMYLPPHFPEYDKNH